MPLVHLSLGRTRRCRQVAEGQYVSRGGIVQCHTAVAVTGARVIGVILTNGPRRYHGRGQVHWVPVVVIIAAAAAHFVTAGAGTAVAAVAKGNSVSPRGLDNSPLDGCIILLLLLLLL